MIYRDYTISPVIHQGTECFKVTPPRGSAWSEIAASIKTAKKWIDADTRSKKAKP